jgi:hypothetical protein
VSRFLDDARARLCRVNSRHVKFAMFYRYKPKGNRSQGRPAGGGLIGDAFQFHPD